MLILQPSFITAVILGREAADVFVVLCGFVFRRHNVWLSRQRSLPQPLVFNDMSWSAQYRQQRGTGLFQNETESHLRLLFFPPPTPPFWQQGAATLSKGHSESDLHCGTVFSHTFPCPPNPPSLRGRLSLSTEMTETGMWWKLSQNIWMHCLPPPQLSIAVT